VSIRAGELFQIAIAKWKSYYGSKRHEPIFLNHIQSAVRSGVPIEE